MNSYLYTNSHRSVIHSDQNVRITQEFTQEEWKNNGQNIHKKASVHSLTRGDSGKKQKIKTRDSIADLKTEAAWERI